MTGKAPDVPTQALAFASLCRTILGQDLIGVYLHGSLVSGGLHPQSDLDLLLVSAGPLSDARRATLLSELLMLSARHPSGPEDPRCLDVLAVSAAELKAPSYPARSEFIYGEWLRTGFDAGDLLAPVTEPVVTLMIAQARSEARAIFGPPFDRIMTELPADQVHKALLYSLPPLLDNLVGDERNVLLTLARMWRTAIEGDFVGKDVAANWAADRSPVALARTLRSCGLAIAARSSMTGVVMRQKRGRPQLSCGTDCSRCCSTGLRHELKNRFDLLKLLYSLGNLKFGQRSPRPCHSMAERPTRGPDGSNCHHWEMDLAGRRR